MCIAPLTLGDGTQVACHNCWQCIEQGVDDWVGRNIAESKTALRSFALTLTYGRSRVGDVDHERARVLTYSDVQNFIKLLRRHRYTVRYFVTGEFGSEKGRAHWHVVLHFGPRKPLVKRGKVIEGADMSPVPPLTGVVQGSRKWADDALSMPKAEIRFMHQRVDAEGNPVVLQNGDPACWWPHGWSVWTEGTSDANIRYNCKYVQKDFADEEWQGKLGMTKKEPLGAAYFRGLAERYVQQELAPQDLHYSFPDVRRKDGMPKQFMLKSRSAELYLEHYVKTWAEVHPGRAMPRSELVETWVEYGVLRIPPVEDGAARHYEALERARERRAVREPLPPLEPVKELTAEQQAHWREVGRSRLAFAMERYDDGQGYDEKERKQRNDEFEAAREREWRDYVRSRGRAPGEPFEGGGEQAQGGGEAVDGDGVCTSDA